MLYEFEFVQVIELFIGAFDYFSFWVYRRLPSKSVRLSFKWKFSIRMMDNPAKFVSHSNMHSWLLPIAWRQDSTLKTACFFITLDNNRQSYKDFIMGHITKIARRIKFIWWIIVFIDSCSGSIIINITDAFLRISNTSCVA